MKLFKFQPCCWNRENKGFVQTCIPSSKQSFEIGRGGCVLKWLHLAGDQEAVASGKCPLAGCFPSAPLSSSALLCPLRSETRISRDHICGLPGLLSVGGPHRTSEGGRALGQSLIPWGLLCGAVGNSLYSLAVGSYWQGGGIIAPGTVSCFVGPLTLPVPLK